MFTQLTSELLDLTASPKGRRPTFFAMLVSSCSCCCCCSTSRED